MKSIPIATILFFSLTTCFIPSSIAEDCDLDAIFTKNKVESDRTEFQSKKLVDSAKDSAAKAQSEFFWK